MSKYGQKPLLKCVHYFCQKHDIFTVFGCFFMGFECFWVIHLLCLYGHSLKSRNHHFYIIFGLMSSLCRCLKYATAKGSKSGKNTERDEVACPRFCMFWVFFMVVKHEWPSVKGYLHSVVIPASRK